MPNKCVYNKIIEHDAFYRAHFKIVTIQTNSFHHNYINIKQQLLI